MTAMPSRRVLDRGRVDQPAHRLDQQQQRAAGDERRLAEHRQRLGLAVAEAMLAIGGAQRVAHREQVDDRGDDVEQRIDQARQQRDRAGVEPRGELDRDQQHCDRDRGVGRAPAQPVAASGRRAITGRAVRAAIRRPREQTTSGRAGARAAPARTRPAAARRESPTRRRGRGTSPLGEAAGELPRPALRARRGSRAGATGRTPRRRSGCRAPGWRNRRRPRASETGCDPPSTRTWRRSDFQRKHNAACGLSDSSVGFAAFEVGVEDKPARIESLEQHGARRRAAAAASRSRASSRWRPARAPRAAANQRAKADSGSVSTISSMHPLPCRPIRDPIFSADRARPSASPARQRGARPREPRRSSEAIVICIAAAFGPDDPLHRRGDLPLPRRRNVTEPAAGERQVQRLVEVAQGRVSQGSTPTPSFPPCVCAAKPASVSGFMCSSTTVVATPSSVASGRGRQHRARALRPRQCRRSAPG